MPENRLFSDPIIGFGFKWLSSLIRVPNPPANITTFIALLLLSIVFIEIYSNGFLPKFSSHPALHPGRYAGRFPDPHRSPSGNSVPAPLIPVNMLSGTVLSDFCPGCPCISKTVSTVNASIQTFKVCGLPVSPARVFSPYLPLFPAPFPRHTPR